MICLGNCIDILLEWLSYLHEMVRKFEQTMVTRVSEQNRRTMVTRVCFLLRALYLQSNSLGRSQAMSFQTLYFGIP